MSCITEITELHEVPGRIRYFVPQIKARAANAAALSDHLNRKSGIYHAKTNSRLGTLIVYFDRTSVTKDALSAHIHSCCFPEPMGIDSHTKGVLDIKRNAVLARRRKNKSSDNSTLYIELLKQGLQAAGMGSSGGIVLGITALKTLLSMNQRIH